MPVIVPTSLGYQIVPPQRGFPIIPSGAVATYAETLRDTYGASEVWPLVDIASGTTINAFINSARNGTLTGWALQDAAGPVTGTLAPSSDGINDFGNIYTSGGGVGLNDIFNGSVFSVIVWGKPTTWVTLGVQRRFIDIRADGSNLFLLTQTGTTGQIQALYRAGGVTKSVTTATGSPAGWVLYGLSVDSGADEMKVFFNGSQTGTTQTGLGTWSGGALNSTQTIIGAFSTTPSLVFDGHLSYVAFKFGSIWSPADHSDIYDAASTAGAD